MSDSVNTNESMIWCAKTGELQSLKTLLKEVSQLNIYLIKIKFSIDYLASGKS